MQMRSELQIQTMIKAMSDVVVPALDPTNKLAIEQAHLVIATLSLMAKQLPLQFRFDCNELARLIAFARSLCGACKGGEQTRANISALSAGIEKAADVLARARAEPSEVYGAVRQLRQLSSALITVLPEEADEPTIILAEKIVLAMSQEQLIRDRAWLLSQGWEPNPEAVPPMSTLLERP